VSEERERFVAMTEVLRRIRAEAEASGKDPLELARQEVYQLYDVIRILGVHGVTCPVCLVSKQPVCIDPEPTRAAIARSMEGAWWQGFGRGLGLTDRAALDRLLKHFCERHGNEMELAYAAQRKGGLP
jgi:hypothetical protein